MPCAPCEYHPPPRCVGSFLLLAAVRARSALCRPGQFCSARSLQCYHSRAPGSRGPGRAGTWEDEGLQRSGAGLTRAGTRGPGSPGAVAWPANPAGQVPPLTGVSLSFLEASLPGSGSAPELSCGHHLSGPWTPFQPVICPENQALEGPMGPGLWGLRPLGTPLCAPLTWLTLVDIS